MLSLSTGFGKYMEILTCQALGAERGHEKAPARRAAGASSGDSRWTSGVPQVLNESLALPSSARSPRRFTASLRKDETAKTVRPTGVPEKGPTRRSARPAALPRRLRMRRVLVGICPCRDVNGCEASRASSARHAALLLRAEKT